MQAMTDEAPVQQLAATFIAAQKFLAKAEKAGKDIDSSWFKASATKRANVKSKVEEAQLLLGTLQIAFCILVDLPSQKTAAQKHGVITACRKLLQNCQIWEGLPLQTRRLDDAIATSVCEIDL